MRLLSFYVRGERAIIAELSSAWNARSGALWIRKLSYLCIQEILVLTKSSLRLSLHVSGCEMSHVLASSPRHILCLTWFWTSMLWSIDSFIRKGIRWPHNSLTWGIFFKLSSDQLLVFNWPRAQYHLFKVGTQFALCLRQKLNFLRTSFFKRSLESFTSSPG